MKVTISISFTLNFLFVQNSALQLKVICMLVYIYSDQKMKYHQINVKYIFKDIGGLSQFV